MWEIYAIRYAHHDRAARENFVGGDPHDTSSMPLDYYVWAVRSANRTFVIDTGFDEPTARKRGRTFLKSPADGLKALDIDPAKVEDVIITHMHYDHSGNHDMFPNARFHIQDREMQFCTGRYMSHEFMRWPFDAEDVSAMIRRLFAGRLVFHNGDEEIAPGLSVHHVGGHTMGMQIVRVETRRGTVVLASDASHLYGNIERGLPYPIAYNMAEVLEGYRRAYALASSREHVIPGHDPLVASRYPSPSAELKGWIVRLD
ncbi:MAG TPA: N-acyl homoserine lactonase family protein [Terriglobia bacterium]|nr:N-acyl homoserine lactonase family protein [Terriglobia bacterium]